MAQGTNAAPDTGEIAALRAEIARLSERLNRLEAREATRPAPQEPEAVPPTPSPAGARVTVDRKGFGASSADGRYTFRVRPRVQVDGHFFPDSDDGNNEVVLRRLRPVFEGEADFIYWRFMPEFASETKIIDAWIDLKLPSETLLRVGKFKGVIGLERLQSFSKTLFIERGLPSVLTPTREIAAELDGKALDGALSWSLGVYDGTLDDTDLTSNRNLGKGFDWGARVFFQPFRNDEESALKGLGIGFAASIGDEETTLDGSADRRLRYRTAGRNTFLQLQNGTALDGERLRLNPHLYYYNGPLGLLAEYVSVRYEAERGGVERTFTNAAWTVQLGYVLTGEDASYNGVRPKTAFSPGHGQWGAWEVAARYNQFAGDDVLFVGSSGSVLATSSSTQKASAVALGVNWYLTDNLLWALNLERTEFSGRGADRDSEEAVLTRLQIDF